MEYDDYLKNYQAYLKNNSFLKEPVALYEPIEYILDLGGKRLRPVLVLAAYHLFDEDFKKPLPAAHAVEVFHNFTLMHDDIMDAAPMRRSAPSVPKKYGPNLAILSGDTMLIKAYQEIEKLSEQNMLSAFSLFNKTALEVCEGQMLDMHFEAREAVSKEEYLEMIKLKTAVLMGCSLKLGGICANANKVQADQLYALGLNMGMAFQIQDDLLDSFGSNKFGKTIGGDILNDKKTILHIHTLQAATPEDQAQLINTNGQQVEGADKIERVTNLYEKYGAREAVEKLKYGYYQKALDYLEELQIEDSKKVFLENLNKKLLERVV